MGAPRARVPYDTCPLCGSTEFSRLTEESCATHPLWQPPLPETMTWCACRECRHIFTDGHFTPEACAVLFSRTHPHQEVGANIEQQRYISGRMVERIARAAPPPGAWLDVGFGNGSLLFAAGEWGYRPVGVDLRSSSVVELARLGFEGHCCDLAQLDHDGRYAVLSMADVLEHMSFPRLGLHQARRLLAPGGLLFLSMPNRDSAAWRALDAQGVNPYWAEIEHFHNFTRARLYSLLEDIGFKPIHYAISERYRLCMEVIALRR